LYACSHHVFCYFRQKLPVWAQHWWNLCEAVAIIVFVLGLGLRFYPPLLDYGRLTLSVNILYWYIHTLKIWAVNQKFGQLVIVTGKPLKAMIPFCLFLIVVLFSYATFNRLVLHPHKDSSWPLMREIFFKPFFMLFGEILPENIIPQCDDKIDFAACHMGRWICVAVTVLFLYICSIIIMNLLFAEFDILIDNESAVSDQVWMFQNFRGVMEYKKKPILPPPLNVLCYVFLLFKYYHNKGHRIQESYNNTLKLFLDRAARECLYGFEEECMEGYLEEQKPSRPNQMMSVSESKRY
jgi:transient receptor potential cation channel subfamily M protein 3